jgi:hypothetical protein
LEDDLRSVRPSTEARRLPETAFYGKTATAARRCDPATLQPTVRFPGWVARGLRPRRLASQRRSPPARALAPCVCADSRAAPPPDAPASRRRRRAVAGSSRPAASHRPCRRACRGGITPSSSACQARPGRGIVRARASRAVVAQGQSTSLVRTGSVVRFHSTAPSSHCSIKRLRRSRPPSSKLNRHKKAERNANLPARTCKIRAGCSALFCHRERVYRARLSNKKAARRRRCKR